jgi:L-asparaginase/Glu-tRNA(Gln) amidotransferase subunit D
VHPRPQLRRAGIVAGQSLSPFKCRILLALALVRDADADRIQGLFDGFGGS